MVIVISLMYTYAILDIENEEFSNVVEKVNMHSEEETNSVAIEAEKFIVEHKEKFKNIKIVFTSCIKPYE